MGILQDPIQCINILWNVHLGIILEDFHIFRLFFMQPKVGPNLTKKKKKKGNVCS